jgi:uncharacterized protein
MTISMYKASAPIFVQFLTSLSAVLDKAAAHAEAKKIGPAVLLNSRLYPDMFPLVRQVREATSHGKWRCAPSAPSAPTELLSDSFESATNSGATSRRASAG